MATDKEQCFEDAMDKYQDATGKDLGLKHRQTWGQRTKDGVWEMEERGFWAGVGSMLKTLRFKAGLGPKPGTYQQVRVPDLTVNDKVVVDTKFTDANGKVDPWGTKPGAGNGNTQKPDYNDINKQNNPSDPRAQDLSLDPKSCKCEQRGEPQQVEVPVYVTSPSPGVYFAPMPSLGGVPVPAGVPVFEPVPIFEPIFAIP